MGLCADGYEMQMLNTIQGFVSWNPFLSTKVLGTLRFISELLLKWPN